MGKKFNVHKSTYKKYKWNQLIIYQGLAKRTSKLLLILIILFYCISHTFLFSNRKMIFIYEAWRYISILTIFFDASLNLWKVCCAGATNYPVARTGRALWPHLQRISSFSNDVRLAIRAYNATCKMFSPEIWRCVHLKFVLWKRNFLIRRHRHSVVEWRLPKYWFGFNKNLALQKNVTLKEKIRA